MQLTPEEISTVTTMSRRSLMWMTVGLEGAIFLVAAVIMWLTGIRPSTETTVLNLGLGVAVGTIMAVTVIPIVHSGGKLLREIRHDLDLVVLLFKKCTVVDLAIVSLLAGVCEEMLFRGLLQTWLTSLMNPHIAILLVALLFGLVHAISRSYVVFATILGLILGYLYYYTDSLASVMIAHAVYDFVALYYGTRTLKPSVAEE